MDRAKLLYRLGMRRSKERMLNDFGNGFWEEFKANADNWMQEILPKVPDIGHSVFRTSYDMCPAYIAWYKSLMAMGFSSEEAGEELWVMSEDLLELIPKRVLKLPMKGYMAGFRDDAALHEQRGKAGKLHPYDWQIVFTDHDDDHFEIDISECAMMKLSKDFDALGMFPAVCRVDFLAANVMGNGFSRTKTLADGDECCNCMYEIGGTCDWNPELGFTDRK